MKSTSSEVRDRLARLKRKRTRRNLASRRKAKLCRQVLAGATVQRTSRRGHWISLQAPREICLYNSGNHKKLTKFLRKLSLFSESCTHIRLDTSRVERATAGGTLLLVAELDRLRRMKPSVTIRGAVPRSNKIKQVFEQIGLARLLRLGHISRPVDDDVVFWRYVTDTDIDGQSAGYFIEEFQKKEELAEESRQNLFAAVTEAVTNTVDHAYAPRLLEPGRQTPDKRWWMFAGVKDGRLVIVQCDLGIGIPKSLPVTFPRERIREFLASVGLAHNDANMIRAAMTLQRSRTGQPNRGRGMRQLKHVVEALNSGNLAIFSNRGVYTYKRETGEEDWSNQRNSVRGTIIQWDVPLSSISPDQAPITDNG